MTRVDRPRLGVSIRAVARAKFPQWTPSPAATARKSRPPHDFTPQGIAGLRKTVEHAARDDAKQGPAKATAMRAGVFAQLLAAIKDTSFDTDKVEVARHAAGTNWFSSAQVATVLGVISFDDARVDAAVAMWTRLVDPENSFVIFKQLDFEGAKAKLRKRVGN